MAIRNIVGKKFNMLTVIRFAGKKNNNAMWLCRCDCGKEKVVYACHLSTGNTKSCGCLNKKKLNLHLIKHGLTDHPLHYTWRSLKQRVINKKNKDYSRYGGRGIGICEEWEKDFLSFYTWAIKNGWKKGLCIDRKDNNGNYEQGNCHLTTNAINCINTRKSRKWFLDGIEYGSSREAAKRLNVHVSTIVQWCNGRKRNNKYYPPKQGCYSELKYKKQHGGCHANSTHGRILEQNIHT